MKIKNELLYGLMLVFIITISLIGNFNVINGYESLDSLGISNTLPYVSQL